MKIKLKTITNLELDYVIPYDLVKTVRKYTLYGTKWYWLSPFEIHSKEIIWTALRLNKSIPIGLRLKPEEKVKKPRILASIFTEERLSNDAENGIAKLLTWILGLDKDIHNFYRLADFYKPLKQAKEDLYGMRIAVNPNIFDLTLLAITLQATSYGRTEKMMRLLYENYGDWLKFDGKMVIVSPAPKQIAEANEDELRMRCRLGYRAKNIAANARMIADGEVPNLSNLKNMSFKEARNSLMKMKGIGEYSREIILFAIHPCFPIDVWSVNHFCRLLGIKLTDKPRRMIPILKKYAEKEFGKWQNYAYDYIINDLEKLSNKFGLEL